MICVHLENRQTLSRKRVICLVDTIDIDSYIRGCVSIYSIGTLLAVTATYDIFKKCLTELQQKMFFFLLLLCRELLKTYVMYVIVTIYSSIN